MSEVLRRQMHQRRWASYRSRVWAKTDTLTLRYCTCRTLLMKRLLHFVKIPGTANPADMRTKGLTQDKIHKYLSEVNIRFCDGRADAAAMLHGS